MGHIQWVAAVMRRLSLSATCLTWTGCWLLHAGRTSFRGRRSSGNNRSQEISHSISQLITSTDERYSAEGLRQYQGRLLIQGILSLPVFELLGAWTTSSVPIPPDNCQGVGNLEVESQAQCPSPGTIVRGVGNLEIETQAQCPSPGQLSGGLRTWGWTQA